MTTLEQEQEQAREAEREARDVYQFAMTDEVLARKQYHIARKELVDAVDAFDRAKDAYKTAQATTCRIMQRLAQQNKGEW